MTGRPSRSPTVSIIMACYNESACVGQAIESIQKQTLDDWELLVFDDGSTDGTATIVQQFANADERIRLYRCGINNGLPACLNMGVWLAQADLIARADADDTNLPDRLERQHQFMLANPEVDVLGTGAILIDSDGSEVRTIHLPQRHEEIQARFGIQHALFFHSSVMVRRSFFDKVGIYSCASYPRSEDRELWLRGLRVGCRYANLPQALIRYQTNGYKRSWKSITAMATSRFVLTRVYRIRGGYYYTVRALGAAVMTRIGLRTARALRHTNTWDSISRSAQWRSWRKP